MGTVQPSYLIEHKNGTLWHLSLSEDKKLQYARKRGNQWLSPVFADRLLIQSFSAAPGSTGEIYAAAYTHTKTMMYYEWDGVQWHQRFIQRIQSRFESVRFLHIVPAPKAVHIVYYIENSLRKTQESLVHYYLDRDEWRTGKGLAFPSDGGIVPRAIAADEVGSLHFFYTQKEQDSHQCHWVAWDVQARSWSTPAPLFRTKGDLVELQLQFIPKFGLCLLWTEKEDLLYSLRSMARRSESESWDPVRLHREELSAPQGIAVLGTGSPFVYSLAEDRLAVYSWDGKAISVAGTPAGTVLTTYVHGIWQEDSCPRMLSMIGTGPPNFEWSLLDAEKAAAKNTPPPPTQEHSKTAMKGPAIKRAVKAHEHPAALEKELTGIKGQLSRLSSKMEELYGSLSLLRDHLSERENQNYQMETTIRRMDFELKQLRSSTEAAALRHASALKRSKPGPNPAVLSDEAVPKVEQQKEAPTEASETEEIQLGNVSIRINPKEESED